MATKVLYYTADVVPTNTELTEIGRLTADSSLTVGVRCVKFVDNSAPGSTGGVVEELETCGGVAGSYPTASGSYVNNYDALITATTVVDYSAEAKGGPRSAFISGAGSLSFSHTGTKQLALIAEGPDGTLSDQTTAAAWTSGTTGTATVGAGTGLVTGVAAGTTVITAVLTYSGKTVTKTATITCT